MEGSPKLILAIVIGVVVVALLGGTYAFVGRTDLSTDEYAEDTAITASTTAGGAPAPTASTATTTQRASCNPPASWKRVTDRGGRFKTAFPKTPNYDKTSNSKYGEYYNVQALDNDDVYVLVMFDEGTRGRPANEVLTQMADPSYNGNKNSTKVVIGSGEIKGGSYLDVEWTYTPTGSKSWDRYVVTPRHRYDMFVHYSQNRTPSPPPDPQGPARAKTTFDTFTSCFELFPQV